MKATYRGCLMVVLLTIVGCIPSLNPVYRPENLVFDPAVIGEWRQPKSNEKWQFTKRDGKSYSLVYTDEQGQQGRFIAHLAEIQGQRFLDLFPDDPRVAVHSVDKVAKTSEIKANWMASWGR